MVEVGWKEVCAETEKNQTSFKLTTYISVPQAAMLTVQEIVNHQLTGAAFKDLYAIQNLTVTYEQSVQPPVPMHKSGEVNAVNGARAPVGKTDRASPKDL